jgi:alkylated DNA nucleotide flippase Atl1
MHSKTREVCSTQPVSNSGLTEVNAARLGAARLGLGVQDKTTQGFQPTKGIQMETKQPDFQLSADSAAIVKAIEEMPVGGVITYAQLSAVIGRDIRHFRGSLESARKSVQRDKGMVFDVIRKEGIKRLADNEIIDLSDKAREHSRRHAKRIAKKLICVNYESLSKDKQVKHNAALSMFGTLSELSSTASMKRLEAQIQATGTQLTSAKSAIAALGAFV